MNGMAQIPDLIEIYEKCVTVQVESDSRDLTDYVKDRVHGSWGYSVGGPTARPARRSGRLRLLLSSVHRIPSHRRKHFATSFALINVDTAAVKMLPINHPTIQQWVIYSKPARF